MSTPPPTGTRWRALAALWGPGFLVALAAGVATAHGLFEVALAAGTPTVIAWLYPLITDGLALVAYATTAKLTGRGRAYAWAVVVLAAGLSGLAQAVFLAGSVAAVPAAVRFGVGAWPAIAAAIVAHLLFMLGHARTTSKPAASKPAASNPPADTSVEPERPTADVQPAVQPSNDRAVQAAVQPAALPPAVPAAERRDAAPANPPVEQPALPLRPRVQPVAVEASKAPQKERARAAARHHQHRTGQLPTVSHLMEIADVARGTAGTALQELREQPADLHIVTTDEHLRNSS